MRLTEQHLRFWQTRKATPQWALQHVSESSPKRCSPTIHSLIEAHAGEPQFSGERGGANSIEGRRYSNKYAASNLLVLLKSARRRGDLAQRLRDMAVTPGTIISAKRRAAFCRKWYRRITGNPAVKEIGSADIRRKVMALGILRENDTVCEPTREGYRTAWKRLAAGEDLTGAAREVLRVGQVKPLSQMPKDRSADLCGAREAVDTEPEVGMQR